jgi:hypothetical protein
VAGQMLRAPAPPLLPPLNALEQRLLLHTH